MTTKTRKTTTKGKPGKASKSTGKAKTTAPQNPAKPKATAEPTAKKQTKAAMVENMLRSSGGATLDAMCEATGWKPHTCRAFMTGLRKKGLTITRGKDAENTSIYSATDGEPKEAKA